MLKKADKNVARLRRHKRVTAKIQGTASRPRLNVFRSANNIYAQLIDDIKGITLVSASTLEKELGCYGGNKEAAHKVGELLAKRASEKNITEAVFDRGGYLFHGRVKELAQGAREGGLKF